MNTRAERRRAAKTAKKAERWRPEDLDRIVEVYWRDVWRFTDHGLRIEDRHTGRLKKLVSL